MYLEILAKWWPLCSDINVLIFPMGIQLINVTGIFLSPETNTNACIQIVGKVQTRAKWTCEGSFQGKHYVIYPIKLADDGFVPFRLVSINVITFIHKYRIHSALAVATAVQMKQSWRMWIKSTDKGAQKQRITQYKHRKNISECIMRTSWHWDVFRLNDSLCGETIGQCWIANTTNPDSKVHGANMGPIWGRQDPGGPHVGPKNLAIRE